MDLFEKYFTLSLKYISLRPRSEKEIVDYLKKKKTPEDVSTKIIARLKEHKFLDDELFAKMWVDGRTRAKPRSKWLLTRELKEKGVSSEIIESVLLSTVDVTSDLSLAKDAIRKRIVKYKDLTRQEIYQKVGGFLARRGFNWETSKRAIDELLKEGYNTRE